MSEPSATRGTAVVLAMVTILAITSTLSSCGRYGRPVRPIPEEALMLDVVPVQVPKRGLESKDVLRSRDRSEKRPD